MVLRILLTKVMDFDPQIPRLGVAVFCLRKCGANCYKKGTPNYRTFRISSNQKPVQGLEEPKRIYSRRKLKNREYLFRK